METHPPPNPAANSPPNPADILSRAIYYQITHTLRGVLPPPVTDTPEDAARRDIAAIAHVASLLPATPEEANVAAQYVAASAQALDCLRLAREHHGNPVLILKCTAQSASMMRQARSWRALLARAQAARQANQADPAAADTAAQTENRALGFMADALTNAPASPAPSATPRLDPIAQAESYALQHRKRAALIRSLGRLPDKLNIGALLPEVVHTIATGTTPILQALGPSRHHPTAAAA